MNADSTLRSYVETRLLPFVEKPMRYMGNELHVHKKKLSDTDVHGVLCFPEVYDIGIAHYGMQILYTVINANPAWALSRAYHPWVDAEMLMRKHDIPLYCLEYFIPLCQADLIGFTLQYELHYTNMINMLSLGNIPIYSQDRGEDMPMVIAGGPVSPNPEPVADFIDAMVIGDGEEVLPEIFRTVSEWKTSRNKEGIKQKRKRELYRLLARIEGVYVPSLHDNDYAACVNGAVRGAKVDALRPQWYPEKPLVPLMNVDHYRIPVEIMRGCTRGCRFCSAGMYYRPVRERNPFEIHHQLASNVEASGCREATFLSLSTGDYSALNEILSRLKRYSHHAHVRISLPSTRADALSSQELNMLFSVSHASSFTIAPEAGSERLRRVINKNLSEEQIIETVKALFQRQIRTLKLYFMIGLPGEREEDIWELIGLVEKIAVCARRYSTQARINVSVSPFSPKPHTPFQWHAMATTEYLHKESVRIKHELIQHRNVKVSYRDPYITFLETVLARGDRNVSTLIHTAWTHGAHFDAWDEHLDKEAWNYAMRSTGVDANFYAFHEYRFDEMLPWQHVSIGVSHDYLRNECEKAAREEITGDCRNSACTGCGVCDDVSKRSLVSRAQGLYSCEDMASDTARTVNGEVTQYYYRCTYEKRDMTRFLGHFDVAALLEQAFRGAGVQLAYSGGYKTRLRLSMGPPPGFGIECMQELFDIVTHGPIEKRLNEINRRLPGGFAVKGIHLLPGKPSSIGSQIAACTYCFTFPEDIDSDAVADACARMVAAQQLIVEETGRKGKKQKDIRPYLFTCEQIAPLGVKAILGTGEQGSCKPRHFARLFCETLGRDVEWERIHVLRTQWWTFDLQRNLVAFPGKERP